jgi:hypothetical protein
MFEFCQRTAFIAAGMIRSDQHGNSSLLDQHRKLPQTTERFFRTFAITMRPYLVVYCMVLELP